MTTKAQITPGRWKFNTIPCNRNQYAEIWGSGRLIAEIVPVDGDEDHANAALIAAAPEMLTALHDALDIIQTAKQYFPKSIKDRDTFHLLNIEANSIRAAIAKATGAA